jgi:hypothetical protein
LVIKFYIKVAMILEVLPHVFKGLSPQNHRGLPLYLSKVICFTILLAFIDVMSDHQRPDVRPRHWYCSACRLGTGIFSSPSNCLNLKAYGEGSRNGGVKLEPWRLDDPKDLVILILVLSYTSIGNLVIRFVAV